MMKCRQSVAWLNYLCWTIGMIGVAVVTEENWTALVWAFVASLHFTKRRTP